MKHPTYTTIADPVWPAVARDGVRLNFDVRADVEQIVSDFTAIAAENKRLRFALTHAAGLVEELHNIYGTMPKTVEICRAALAEPTT